MLGPRKCAILAASTVVGLLGCTDGNLQDRYASAVERYQAGPAVRSEAPYYDPARALGAPDGKTVALAEESVLVVRFFREIPDAPGSDLRLFEVGSDSSSVRVSVSADGRTFVPLTTPGLSGGATELDLDGTGLPFVSFVSLEGLDNFGTDPGFDLDAVEALH
jgi:hypothetical protein